MSVVDLAGWLPALIFPLASVAQLVHLVRTRDATGVSLTAWIAFALGNLALYVYVEKYAEPQAIVGLLGTFVLQLGIIAAILAFRRRRA